MASWYAWVKSAITGLSLHPRHKRPLFLLALTWGLYFLALMPRILEFTDEGLYGGHVNVWSDWALHIGMVNTFAYKSPWEWFAYHPIYAQGAFTYPFLTNLISGLLLRVGLSLIPAMVLPSIFFVWLLLFGLYLLFEKLLHNTWQAVTTIFLFLLSSGPGFLRYGAAIWARGELFFPDQDYSRIDDHQWYAGNVIEGLLIPQRAFLLGMTLGVWALYCFFLGLSEATEKPKLACRYFSLSGLLVGTLAFTHVHSLIAISLGMALVAGHFLFLHSKKWWLFIYLALPSCSLVFCYYFFFLRNGIETKSFQTYSPGWTAKGDVIAWVWLWLKIWGLSLPLTIWGYDHYCKHTSNLSTKIFFGSFFILFGFTNLFLLQPVAWDNSKVFFWCYLMFCAMIAYYLDRLRQCRPLRWLVVCLLGLLCLSGFIEVLSIQFVAKHRYLMTASEEIRLGEEIRAKTASQDVFLTAPDHNHFILMWAQRPIVLGYWVWAWNFGFNYEETLKDVHAMLQGATNTLELFRKHHIHYVVIGAKDLAELHVNQEFYAKFPISFQSSSYRVYDVGAFAPKTLPP